MGKVGSRGKGGHWSRKLRSQFLAAPRWTTRKDPEASNLDLGQRDYPLRGPRDRMALVEGWSYPKGR